ncbi:MAG: hypothetical protein DCC71_03675 [Proteobacteria bacterium]|nr:MAG: hypothetical protein DCC71_03675 [Pseudomonadota bacterium]
MPRIVPSIVRFLCLALMANAISSTVASASDTVLVYKTPRCGCCVDWVTHLRANGFSVTVEEVQDLSPIKARFGVPADLESCHTATVDGYVVEGHVPASDIQRLLAEEPAARGIAVPRMPVGSPGMERGDEREPYQVIQFGDQGRAVFATHGDSIP